MASSSGRNWGHMAAMNQYKQVFCDVFGITLDKFQDFEENDIVECFKIEWRKKSMAMERER